MSPLYSRFIVTITFSRFNPTPIIHTLLPHLNRNLPQKFFFDTWLFNNPFCFIVLKINFFLFPMIIAHLLKASSLCIIKKCCYVFVWTVQLRIIRFLESSLFSVIQELLNCPSRFRFSGSLFHFPALYPRIFSFTVQVCLYSFPFFCRILVSKNFANTENAFLNSCQFLLSR